MIDLREIGWEGVVDWMHVAQDRNQWQVVKVRKIYVYIEGI
jgi:hypothetical protein